MKYQVFLCSLVCVFSSSVAMERSSNKSLENSAQVADALQNYSMYLLAVRLIPMADRENLAQHISDVRKCPLTDKKRNQALRLIRTQHLELIDNHRRAWAEQENWRIENEQPSKKRRRDH